MQSSILTNVSVEWVVTANNSPDRLFPWFPFANGPCLQPSPGFRPPLPWLLRAGLPDRSHASHCRGPCLSRNRSTFRSASVGNDAPCGKVAVLLRTAITAVGYVREIFNLTAQHAHYLPSPSALATRIVKLPCSKAPVCHPSERRGQRLAQALQGSRSPRDVGGVLGLAAGHPADFAPRALVEWGAASVKGVKQLQQGGRTVKMRVLTSPSAQVIQQKTDLAF